MSGADPQRWQALTVFGLVGAAIAAVDQLTKIWALGALEPGHYYPIWGSFFGLNLVRNPGAAFSFLSNHTWVFTLLTVLILVAVAGAVTKLSNPWWALALGLLAGGGVGNLIDRLIRPPYQGQGHVVDFLAYSDWFVGNVADIAIVLAGAIAVLLLLLDKPLGQASTIKNSHSKTTVPLLDNSDRVEGN